MLREAAPIDAQAFQYVMDENLGLGLLKDTRAIDIILAPDLIDALSKYFADIRTLGL